jgi:hypothetical protein
MARVQITVRALADLELLFDFLAEHNPKPARERMLSVRRHEKLKCDISRVDVSLHCVTLPHIPRKFTR